LSRPKPQKNVSKSQQSEQARQHLGSVLCAGGVDRSVAKISSATAISSLLGGQICCRGPKRDMAATATNKSAFTARYSASMFRQH
jgi:hypothetical protein